MKPASDDSGHYHVPLDDDTLARLRRLAAATGLSPEALAGKIVEEKLETWQVAGRELDSLREGTEARE